MDPEERCAASPTVWAYAYELVPPQPERGLQSIRALLEREHAEARRTGRTWAGRFVREHQVTYILVVSDRPDQLDGPGRRIRAALAELHAEFLITAPLAVVEPGSAAVGWGP